MKRVVLYGIIGFLLLDFMGIAVVKAQEVKSRVISGIVRNRDNRKELENVNVSVVGSNVGTVTNKDGAVLEQDKVRDLLKVLRDIEEVLGMLEIKNIKA